MNTTYAVTGMTCNHCVMHIKQEVGKVPGVTATELALSDGLLHVTSDQPVDFALIQAAVEDAGDYSVVIL
ncbi:MAG: heavy-metal-associated domain-containing protein [Propionibacteriaceae bacterium]|nr:heavy-metal-associated domain-containing protein [Propionibacteriaceae bacterium]